MSLRAETIFESSSYPQRVAQYQAKSMCLKCHLIVLSFSLWLLYFILQSFNSQNSHRIFLSALISSVLTVRYLLMTLQFTHQPHTPNRTPHAGFLLLPEYLSLEMLSSPQINSVPKYNFASSFSSYLLCNIVTELPKQSCFHHSILSCLGVLCCWSSKCWRSEPCISEYQI